jgi:hypothetical protein
MKFCFVLETADRDHGNNAALGGAREYAELDLYMKGGDAPEARKQVQVHKNAWCIGA